MGQTVENSGSCIIYSAGLLSLSAVIHSGVGKNDDSVSFDDFRKRTLDVR